MAGESLREIDITTFPTQQVRPQPVYSNINPGFSDVGYGAPPEAQSRLTAREVGINALEKFSQLATQYAYGRLQPKSAETAARPVSPTGAPVATANEATQAGFQFGGLSKGAVAVAVVLGVLLLIGISRDLKV